MFGDVYVKPWCRIGPYVVGIVTGYLLHITERNKPSIQKVILEKFPVTIEEAKYYFSY